MSDDVTRASGTTDVRWHAHPFDRCTHAFVERERYTVWTSGSTGGEAPAGTPVCVNEQRTICGAWRQRWE